MTDNQTHAGNTKGRKLPKPTRNFSRASGLALQRSHTVLGEAQADHSESGADGRHELTSRHEAQGTSGRPSTDGRFL